MGTSGRIWNIQISAFPSHPFLFSFWLPHESFYVPYRRSICSSCRDIACTHHLVKSEPKNISFLYLSLPLYARRIVLHSLSSFAAIVAIALHSPSLLYCSQPSLQPHLCISFLVAILSSLIRCLTIVIVGHQAANCPKAGTPTCYNCGAEGHVSRDCSAPAKAKSCYKCGQEGHISRDCPDAGASSGGGFSSGGGSGAECYKCGKVGHIARSCPEAGSGGQGGGYSSFGGGAQKTCYSCGGVGHLSRDCVQGSKCYNCSGTGHISRDCPQPQKRACYTCGSEGHISRDCPGVGASDAAA